MLIKAGSHRSGGAATALLTSPLDVLRTRLQSDFYRSQHGSHSALRGSSSLVSSRFLRTSILHFRETFQMLFAIRRFEGWRGLFTGLGPNLTGIVPATAIKFYTYGNCKRIISETMNCRNDAALVHIGAAATAGVVTGSATNPIWLVKTRMQLDRTRPEKADRRYKNSLDCTLQILRQEGIKGMYRGLGASYLGVAESTLHLTLYEQMKISISRRKEMVRSDVRGKTSWDHAADWVGMSAAAGISKLFSVLVGYPHEVLSTPFHSLDSKLSHNTCPGSENEITPSTNGSRTSEIHRLGPVLPARLEGRGTCIHVRWPDPSSSACRAVCCDYTRGV